LLKSYPPNAPHFLLIYREDQYHRLLVTFCEGKGTAPVSLVGKIPQSVVSIPPSKGERTMETAMIQTPEFEGTQTTDPREAKLREIIEKGKVSLQKTLGENGYLDLAAYHYLNHPDSVKEFYFVLIIDTENPPWILTRYKSQRNLFKGLTHHGLFQMNRDTGSVLSKGIGWLTWKQLRKILEATKPHFRTEAERRFVEDLILYLDYKIREGERIRNERKQLSFW
jgi:hypothetical protein